MAVNKIGWSPEAVKDVESIIEYLTRNSPFFAKTVAAKLFASARNLGAFPSMGRLIPGIGDSAVREVVVYNYRLVYRIEKFEILVVAIVHGKR